MKLLLDTHILLWAITDDGRVSAQVQKMIGSSRNQIFFSLASVWEVAIKHIAKSKAIPISEDAFVTYCVQSGYMALPIEIKHLLMLKTLRRNEDAPMHKDPFDRLLIAQAKTEGMTFVTHDKLLPDYEEPCILLI